MSYNYKLFKLKELPFIFNFALEIMGRAPVNKKRISNTAKQDEIATKLGKVFFDRGFSAISTEELCEIAGKSKATIYKYFESKEEMISYITSKKLSEIKSFEGLLFANELSFAERYRKAVMLVIKAFEGISHFYLTDLKQEYPSLFDALTNLKNFSIVLLEDFYGRGIESGDFRNLDPKLLAANDDLFFTAILETEFLNDKTFSIHELFENYFNSRFKGILKSNIN